MPSPKRTAIQKVDRVPTGLRARKDIARRVQNGVQYVWSVLPGLRSTALARSNIAAKLLLGRTADDQRKEDVSKLPESIFDPSIHPIEIAPDVRLLPPPPPPPLDPTPIFSINSSLDGLHQLDHAFPTIPKRKFEELEATIQELEDVNQDLTGSRFRLQRDRTRFQNFRKKTGEKEGSALNLLRGFLEEKGITLPRNIEESFEQVHTLRDQLGIREAEYDDAEQRYNDQELRFIQKLSHFFDNMPDDFLRPLHIGRPDVFSLQANDAVNSTSVAPDSWVILNMETGDTDVPEAGKPSTMTNASTTASEISKLLANVATSNTSGHSQTGLAPPKNERHDFLEPDHRIWLTSQTNINSWLLDVISTSPLRKAFLPVRPETNELYEASWWETSREHWYLTSSIGTQFYTDSSTVLEKESGGCTMGLELDELLSNDAIRHTLLPVQPSSAVNQDKGSPLHGAAALSPVQKPQADVSPETPYTTPVTTDSGAIRSYSSRWRPSNKYATRTSTMTSTNTRCLRLQTDNREDIQQRRYTTGRFDVYTPNQCQLFGHCPDNLLSPKLRTIS